MCYWIQHPLWFLTVNNCNASYGRFHFPPHIVQKPRQEDLFDLFLQRVVEMPVVLQAVEDLQGQ